MELLGLFLLLSIFLIYQLLVQIYFHIYFTDINILELVSAAKFHALTQEKAKNQQEINQLDTLMKNPKTFAEVASSVAQSQVDSQYGQAVGISKNLDKNAAMYMENTQYGEMSKQQSTNARINELGGVDKAVDFDVTSAKVKATEDKAALGGKLEEALRASGVKGEKAKELAQAIIEGSKAGAEEFRKALDKIGEKAGTLTSAKERSDYSKIDQYDTPEDFVKAQALSAIQQEDKGAKRLFDGLNNSKLLQNRVDGIMKGAKQSGSKYEKEAEDYLISQGMAYKGKDGKLHAIDNPEAWVRGLALATGSNMERLFIGGMRIDQKYNPETGEVLTNADASQSFKDGTRIDTGDRVNATPGHLQRIMEKLKEEHPNWTHNQLLNAAKKEVAEYNKNLSEQSSKDDLALNAPGWVNAAAGLLDSYGVIAGGVGAVGGIIEKVTAKGVKLKHDELLKNGAVYKAPDPEEGISGGYYKDGVRIADAEGYLVDRKGERVTKGWVSKGWDKTTDIFDKLVGGEPSSQTFNNTINGTTNNSTDENYRNTDNHSENEKLHNNPPLNSDTRIVNNGEKNVKGSGLVEDAEKVEGKGIFKTLGNVANKVKDLAKESENILDDLLKTK